MSFGFVFFDLKNESISLCSPKNAKSDRIFSDWRIRWPKSSDFGQNSDDLSHKIFESKNGMVSKFQGVIHNQRAAAAKRSMSWMVTQLYSDVVSRPTRGRRVFPCSHYNRLARARAWRPREAHSARISPWLCTRRHVQQQQHQQSVTLRNTK